MDRRGGGCAAVLFAAVVIGLLLWALAIALMILGVVVGLGGVVAAGVIVARAIRGARRDEEVAEMGELIARTAQEAERDAISSLVDLDELIRTRGVGTAQEAALWDKPAALRGERRRLEATINRLAAASDARSRLSAIVEAEAVRMRVNALIDGDG